LRLVHALPRLQILVNALLKSIPSMGYVSIFLMLHFYVYAVAGVFMFGHNDPEHFATLPTALLTLFTVVTMEGWADVMYTQMPVGAPLAAGYFITFILLGTMIILNLFIGVIMNGMNEATEENEKLTEAREGTQRSLQHDVHDLHKKLEELTDVARKLKDRADDELKSRRA
jgi:voltage-gated sodium channel